MQPQRASLKRLEDQGIRRHGEKGSFENRKLGRRFLENPVISN